MPRGLHARGGLRSHRRRIGKHLIVAPWIIITVVAVILLAGMSVGYAWLITRGCSGSPVTATIAVDSDVSKILDTLGRQWSTSQPSVHGRCGAINVVSKESADAAAALSPNWDPRVDGDKPDVWVPESSLWARLAQTRQDAARMIPDRQPSLARSPAVIAMPQPMAKALGWPSTKLTWHDLIGTYVGSNWSQYGHADWGPFKLAMSNPAKSTAALHALLAISDTNNDGEINASEGQAATALWSAVSATKSGYQNTLEGIEENLTKDDEAGEASVLQYASAFPALESDVYSYNSVNPRVPLAAVYPTDGSADADFPYLILNWSHGGKSDPDQTLRDQVAQQFLTYLKGPDGRKEFQRKGYRDANRNPGATLTSTSGVVGKLRTLPRSVLLPDSISQTVAVWTAVSRPSNILLVMDTSSTTSQQVPGTDKTQLQVVSGATADAVKLFGSQTKLGLWQYASNLAGGKDYRELVSPGDIDGSYGSGTRRARITDSLAHLETGGKPALFSTVAAAYQAMRSQYVAGSSNAIVVISAGGKDTSQNLTLDQLTSQLKKLVSHDQPLPVFTVGYGPQSDLSSLQAISTTTNGRTYTADNPTEIGKVMLTALFSNAPPSG